MCLSTLSAHPRFIAMLLPASTEGNISGNMGIFILNVGRFEGFHVFRVLCKESENRMIPAGLAQVEKKTVRLCSPSWQHCPDYGETK